MKLKLAEPIFETIQGEGLYAGTPSLFIRTSGCNLRCWWCDTPHSSWRPEGQSVLLIDVLAKVQQSKCKHVVITGGEPMLWPEHVANITAMARRWGKVVTIETNGTIFNEDVQPNLWSISPKLPSSAPVIGSAARTLHDNNNRLPDVQRFAQVGDQVQLKYVLECDADVDAVKAQLAQLPYHGRGVWAMPQGRTLQEVLERGRWLAEVCKREGWHLCLRQHILLWGNVKGV